MENFQLKPVEKGDADFIAEIRSNPKINKYLSSQKATSREEQEIWISNINKDDYYFIIQNNNINYGTISIYDINKSNNRAEFGRFICLNPIYSIKSEMKIIDFAFNYLKLNEIYCRTIAQNTKVWSQHYNFGFKDFGYETLNDGRKILVQKLFKSDFEKFDYSKIINILSRF